MKKYPQLVLITLLLILSGGCDNKPVDYLHETQEEKQSRMDWWEDARFGMFIHWGLYAIPAGEWEGETNHAEWIRTTARIPLETYDGLAGSFNPVRYDPAAWVELAAKAGMKYIVITSKHHDGFCLFDSDYTDFDIMSTPFAKDILGPLAKAARKKGIRICWYHSIMDWHHPDYLPRRSWEKERTADEADFNRYVEHMKNQLRELVRNYGDIGVLWFDGEWEETWTHEHGKDLYNYVRNLQPDIIINNRVDVGRSGMAGLTKPGDYVGDFGTPEQEIPATGLPGSYWETCMTMNDHWGYNKADSNWKSTRDLIWKLADITSKGGNFLLNIGPKADGTFPEESIGLLNSIGDWMDVNGESIYGTSASPFKKLHFGRCTHKPGKNDARFYFHVFDWPSGGTLKIPGIYNRPVHAYLLSDPGRNKLETYRMEDAIIIKVPASAPDDINSVVVLDVAGAPDISNPPLIESENGIFIDMITLDIRPDMNDTETRYTLDGSIPDATSDLVTGPVTVDQTTVVTARNFRNGEPVSDTTMLMVRKVRAADPLAAGGLAPGLNGRYYEGEWDSIPAFSEMTPMKQIVAGTFNLDTRERDDYYGFSFEGLIEIPEDGVYNFYTESDDGSCLYINDSLIVDNDGLHGMQEARGTVPLRKGLHRIRVNYFERTGSDGLKVLFRGPGLEPTLIPAESLFHREGKK